MTCCDICRHPHCPGPDANGTHINLYDLTSMVPSVQCPDCGSLLEVHAVAIEQDIFRVATAGYGKQVIEKTTRESVAICCPGCEFALEAGATL